MGYFDGLTASAFKTDASGRTVYFPWGRFGSGYVVTDDERRDGIRRSVRNTVVVSFFAIIVVQAIVGFVGNLVLLPAYYVWYYFATKKRVHGLERSSEKLTLRESYRNSALAHNLATLIALFVVAIGFVAVAVATFDSSPVMAIVTIGFFGLSGLAIGYMVLIKLAGRSSR